MDDTQKEKALQEDIGGIPVPSPSTETSTEEAVEVEEEAQAEPKAEEAKTEEGSKKGASNRIRELNAKKKLAEARAEEAETKAQSLTEKLGELMTPIESAPASQEQFKPKVEPGAEISLDDYKRDVTLTAQGLVNLELRKERAINRIDKEATEVVSKYPELDPDSDSFDRELSDTITEAVEAHVKASPYTASVKKFTARLMKPYQRAVKKEAGKVTENVAKQASETAARPTSVKGGEKKFEELSEEEMEERLGIVY